MYCPKCGTELKNGFDFCPKCGAKLSRNTAAEGIEAKNPLPTPSNPAKIRRIIPVIVGCAALFLVFTFLFFRSGPVPEETETKQLLTEYLKQQTYDSSNQELMQECLSDEVEDLLSLLSKRLSSVLGNFGMSLDQEEISGIQESCLEYIRENQAISQAFSSAVADRSEITIREQKRRGQKLRVKVTISSLDLSSVNQELLDETLNVENLTDFLSSDWMQLLKGFAFSSEKVEYLFGVILESVPSSGEKKTYTGTAELTYNKEKELWEVSSVDQKLLRAYFAME